MSDSATSQTVARQAPLSMGIPKQANWSGCHFLLQGIFPTRDEIWVSCVSALAGRFFTTRATSKYFIHVLCLAAQYCLTLCDLTDYSPQGSSVHGYSPGKDTGVDCHALVQGIFPIHGSNPGLPHCRQILYHLSQQGSPRILEWVAYSLSRGTFRPRNWARVSCTGGGFFTSWVIQEALFYT